MEKLIQTIKQTGISGIEARVYMSALELGECSMTNLAKKSGLKRPTVYLAIEELEFLGLISKIKKGKRNYVSPVHPRRLLQIAQHKEKIIQDDLPELIGVYTNTSQKPTIQMFEGMKAVTDIYRESFQRLKNGEELLIFTDMAHILEKHPHIPAEFEKIAGQIIYKSKIREITYGDEAGKKYVATMKDKVSRGYQLRLSDSQFLQGQNEQFIFKDKIIYFSLTNDIFVVVIESEDLARTHKALFEMAWKSAEEIGF